MIWLLRAARWVRRPPSRQRVILVFSVVGLCLALVLFEWVFGWPDALRLDPRPGIPRHSLPTAPP